MSDLKSLINFIKLTTAFQRVQRRIRVTGEHRWENDAEHSFQLAITAWYLAEQLSLDLDLTKVLKYALAHDLVEIYAGDTFIYGEQKDLDSKKEREQLAADRLVKELPEFTDLHQIIADYEQLATPESLFIYTLDKLIPVVNVYLDKGNSWKELNISFDDVYRTKIPQADNFPKLKPYFEEILAILKEKGDELFNGA